MVVAVFILLCLIWSSTWLGIKYAIQDVTPVTAAAARFLLAAGIYLTFHVVRGIRFPRSRRMCLAIALMGVPHICIPYALTYWAEQHITSGMTSVLFATFPFVVAGVSAWMVAGEAWTRQKAIGLVCGFIGVAVVFREQLGVESDKAAVAVLAVLGATLSGGSSIAMIKRWFNREDTVALTALQMIGAAVSLTLLAFAVEHPLDVTWTATAFVATCYLAIFGSAIAFFGYYWLLKRIEGTAAASITFVTPVVALILGWIFQDERITPSLIVGAALVLIGVRFVMRSPSRPSRKPSAGPNRRAA